MTDCSDCCKLTLPNDRGYLPAALGFVHNVAEYLGFSETDRRRIELATEEAVTNVIEHAFGTDETSSFDILCRKIPGGMEVCVHDMGIPWDPTLDEDYHPEADLDHQTGQGLGKHLIQQLMDEYAFDNLGHDGKQVRLVKYLDSQYVGEGLPEGHEVEIAKPPETKPEPVPLEFRRMRPEEAIEVARAVFECYGYSYAGEFMYYPERIAAMNAEGQMFSAVAVDTETGEIAGHNALVFNPALPAELAVAVTKMKFRGMGIARSLGEFLAQEARDMGLKGMYVKEVTVHPYTQKFCRKLGFEDCGLLLAHSPKSLAFKGISDHATQRNSDLLGFRQLHAAELREVYPPVRHREVIERIYQNLGLPIRCLDSGAEPAEVGKTVIKAQVNTARSLCEIHVTHYGADLVWALKHELRRIRRNEVQLVEMYLNLHDPVTPWVVAEAEKLGFFFTGIVPEAATGDVVIMQFFNGIAVEYEELVIERPETAELLDYVKGLDPTMV